MIRDPPIMHNALLFYKAPNTPLRKPDHLSQAIGDMVCVYSY